MSTPSLARDCVYEQSASLAAVWRLGYRGPVELRGDSLLVANHYNGTWGCGAPHLAPLLERLRRAATVFTSLVITWIPRAQNERADALTRQAVREALRCYGRPGRPAVGRGSVAS